MSLFQRRTTSNIKGIVTLGKARHPIDAQSYFRSDFFDGLAWSGTPVPRGVKETADLGAEVVVHGTSLGTKVFSVDHQTSRISNQNNVPTWLHWEAFGQYLRANNHVDDFVSIERLADGAFRVIIDTDPSGPFIAG